LFNGVDSDFSCRIETKRDKNIGATFKKICFFGNEENNKYNFSNCELMAANGLLRTIAEESRAIDTWQLSSSPLAVINRYMQTIGCIPKELLRVAGKVLLELYKIRNDNEKIKILWQENWQDNISIPFLRLIEDKDNLSKNIHPKEDYPKYSGIDQKTAGQKTDIISIERHVNKREEAIKVMLEESAEARGIRVRDHGYEIYKLLKNQHPNKKITKEMVAEQIMKEEQPLYKLVAIKDPLKKQPALGTYLKELRKIH